VRLTDASVMADMTLVQLGVVFRPDEGAGPVPLLEERLVALREAGRVLREHYGGRVALMVAQAGGSAQQLLKLVTRGISSYRDWCDHRGRRVWFLKRAQILVADIWAAFGGVDYGRFDDINSVTMFADYRVPQLLCALGVLRYSLRLREALLAEEAIGAEWECEIRGASIHAVELLRDDAAGCNAIEIDFYLWDEAKARGAQLDQWPIHKKRTIFYNLRPETNEGLEREGLAGAVTARQISGGSPVLRAMKGWPTSCSGSSATAFFSGVTPARPRNVALGPRSGSPSMYQTSCV
jgi:hypothetical protein